MDTLEEASEDDNFAKHIYGGLASGCMNALVTQPFDTAKTRLQIVGFDKYKLTGETKQKIRPPSGSTLKLIRSIYNQEGIRALYRGLPPSLFSVCFSMSIFFPMYQKMRTVYVEKFDKDLNHPFVIVPSVLTAWFCSSVFTSPISLVKVRLQTQKSKKGFFSTFYEVYQQGIKGMYAGYRAMIFFAALFSLHFSIYEPLKYYMIERTGLPTYICAPIASSMSVTVAFVSWYPNDVILSRLQYQGKDKQYTGIKDAFQKIVKNEGFRGLYAGLSAYLMRFIIGTVATMSTFEFITSDK